MCANNLLGVRDLDRWISLSEATTEFRMGPRAVLRLIKDRTLVAIRLRRRGKNPLGQWRILYPGPVVGRFIAESKRHIEHVPLLSSHEVGEALGITPGAVRQLKKRGGLHGSKVGNTTLYTAAEVRELLFRRERKKRTGRRMYSPILACWLRRLVDQHAEVDVQVLDTLLRESVGLVEPMKSHFISEVWGHFDAINELMRWAQEGGDMAHRPRGPHSPGSTQRICSNADIVRFLSNVRNGRAAALDSA